MTRALYVLWSDEIRDRVAHLVQIAPKETRVTFQDPKRTPDQNSKMWAMLTDVSEQKDHLGRKYTPDQWKVIFMHALGQETQFVPSLDGKTFIPIGHRSSELSIGEMADLITLMDAWGSENGVIWTEPKELRGVPARSKARGVSASSHEDVRREIAGAAASIPLVADPGRPL